MLPYIKVNGVPRQILISLCIYMGQMIIGFTTSWTGSIFPMLEDLSQSPLPYLLSDSQLSLVASLLYIGGIPGPYIMGWWSNVKGRKPCLIVGGILLSTSYLVLTTSKNLAMLYCGRLLSGIGTGIVGVINLVYLGEIASTNIRGILLTNLGIFNTCGSILMFTVGSFLSYTAATSVGLILSIAFTICMMFITESPIYYLLRGKDEAVRKILLDLGRSNDINLIIASRKEFKKGSTIKEWIELFTVRSNRKGLIIVVITNIFQHCSGIITVVVYSAIIFKMAGSSINSNVAMIVIGFFQLSGSVIAPLFIERSGRKILMCVSCAVTSLSMLLLGFYFYFNYIGSSWINNIKWLPLLILILFFIAYDFGLGIIPNTLIGEMFTTNVRSKGSAVAMTSSWLSGFVVTTVFGSVLDTIGAHVAFWFFSCSCAGALVFTMLCIPETKGKSLMEIQDMIEN